ncbi:hypothetical protein [Clostridium akagii]|uniref:hypothetical protein n=1 Tax=Clostridium akagii TaxID=91623 RepID=UPI00047C67AF|nr:hypothetical protein [Clostridium akagii]
MSRNKKNSNIDLLENISKKYDFQSIQDTASEFAGIHDVELLPSSITIMASALSVFGEMSKMDSTNALYTVAESIKDTASKFAGIHDVESLSSSITMMASALSTFAEMPKIDSTNAFSTLTVSIKDTASKFAGIHDVESLPSSITMMASALSTLTEMSKIDSTNDLYTVAESIKDTAFKFAGIHDVESLPSSITMMASALSTFAEMPKIDSTNAFSTLAESMKKTASKFAGMSKIDSDILKDYDIKKEDFEEAQNIVEEIITSDNGENYLQEFEKKMLNIKKQSPFRYELLKNIILIIFSFIISLFFYTISKPNNINQINNTLIINNYGYINKDKKSFKISQEVRVSITEYLSGK